MYRYVYIIITILLIILDLITKHYLTTVCNTGVSFSLPISYIVVIPLSIVVTVYMLYLAHTKQLSDIVTMFIVAGTIGNLYDRVFWGCVRDWIVMPGRFVYNIADVCLTVGVLFYIYKEYKPFTSFFNSGKK